MLRGIWEAWLLGEFMQPSERIACRVCTQIQLHVVACQPLGIACTEAVLTLETILKICVIQLLVQVLCAVVQASFLADRSASQNERLLQIPLQGSECASDLLRALLYSVKRPNSE